MQEIRIERMQPADALAAASIEKELFGQPWSCEGFLSALASQDAFYLSVFLDGKLVGYCGFYQSFEEAEITNVAVAPSCQRDRDAHVGRADPLRRKKRRGAVYSGSTHIQWQSDPAL